MSSSYSWKSFQEDAKNPLFVAMIFWALLTLLGLAWPDGWGFVFAMMIGFSFFDLILGVFVKGRKLPLSEKWYEFKAKGWVFGAFLIGIAFATISSAFLAQIATGSVNQPSLSLGDRVARVAIADVLATFLLWLDFDSKVWNA